MAASSDDFIRSLTGEHRVVLLGGLAIIAHGFSRSTYDGDIWLDPMEDEHQWAQALTDHLLRVEGLTLHRLPDWAEISPENLPKTILETRMVRILGLQCPLDVFREPNELPTHDFDDVYSRGHRAQDGTVLPAPLDLIQSKWDTGREKDQQDILFLESLVRADYKQRLPTATLAEATSLLARYSEWQVLQAALENPLAEVRALASQHLREFANAGDPFSLAIIEGREIP
jgi:hypothetical protein